MYRWKYLANLALLLAAATNPVFAIQQVEVHLTHLEVKRSAERGGDHLYFSITEYPVKGEPKLTRVPAYPKHWLLKEISNIKDVLLWKGVIDDMHSVLLVFSLMEEDFPMLNPDDLIGSVQVNIVNNNNKITTKWGLPHYIDNPKQEQPDPKHPLFLLFGEQSEYVVEFKVVD